MMWYSMLAYIGGFILGLQMLPQIYKVFITKSATDLSLLYLCMNAIGLICMNTYAFSTHQLELFIPTGISLVNTIIMILLKVYYDYTKASKDISFDENVP